MEKPDSAPPARRSHTKLTIELITDALRDHYHNSVSDTAICRKYNITRTNWNDIKSAHGEKFIAKFGKIERKAIDEIDLSEHWESLLISKPQPIIYTAHSSSSGQAGQAGQVGQPVAAAPKKAAAK